MTCGALVSSDWSVASHVTQPNVGMNILSILGSWFGNHGDKGEVTLQTTGDVMVPDVL